MIYRCLGISQIFSTQAYRSVVTPLYIYRYIYISRRTPIKYIIAFYLIVRSHTNITYFATLIPV